MTKYTVEGTELTAIADAIRSVNGETTKYTVGQMHSKINDVDDEVDEQADLISQIQTALQDKAAGDSSGANVETWTGTIYGATVGLGAGSEYAVYYIDETLSCRSIDVLKDEQKTITALANSIIIPVHLEDKDSYYNENDTNAMTFSGIFGQPIRLMANNFIIQL